MNYPHLEALSHELTQMVSRVASVVVAVDSGRGPGASGLLWSEQSVLTLEHRLENDQADVYLSDGSVVKATLAGRSPGWDLALLRLDRPVAFDPPPWNREPGPGLVVSLGRDHQGGLVSAISLMQTLDSHRHPPRPELAGATLVDHQGRLLGLHCGHPPQTLPYSRLVTLVEQLESGGNLEPGFLGLGLMPLEHEGCLVVKIEPDSPAQQAGVMLGDTLLRLDDQAVNGPEEVMHQLRSLSPGREVRLALMRAGQPLEVTATLAERPIRHGAPHHPGPHHHRGHHHPHHRRRHFIHKVLRHFGPPGPPPGRGGPPVC